MIERPKVRQGITWSEIYAGGDLQYVISDAENKKVFRVGRVEGILMESMTGQRSLEEISDLVDQQHDIQISMAELQAFTDQLASYQILESALGVDLEEKTRRQFTPLIAIDGARLAMVFRIGQSLFKPPLFPLLAGAAGISIVFVCFHFLSIAGDFLQRLDLEKLIFMQLWILLTGPLHEAGHGSALTRFGQAPGEVGMGFRLGVYPFFYTNTNAAWLLPSRFQRMLVALGGVFVDSLLLTLLFWLWLLGNQASESHIWITMLLFGSILKVVNNLNCYSKKDGYYVMMDYLEVPHLKEKAWMWFGKKATRDRLTEEEEQNASKYTAYISVGLLTQALSISSFAFVAYSIFDAIRFHRFLFGQL